jgi:hypothetical protein
MKVQVELKRISCGIAIHEDDGLFTSQITFQAQLKKQYAPIWFGMLRGHTLCRIVLL